MNDKLFHARLFCEAHVMSDPPQQNEFLKDKLKNVPTARSQVDSLTRLLNRRKLASAFYELRDFNGLWGDFQPGNLSDLVALRCGNVSTVAASRLLNYTHPSRNLSAATGGSSSKCGAPLSRSRDLDAVE